MSEIKAITFNGKDKRFKVLADIPIDDFFISAWRDYRKKVILYREINEKIINLYVKQYNLKMHICMGSGMKLQLITSFSCW